MKVRTSKGHTRAQIFRDARPDLRYWLLVVFSCAIATLGLLANSPAVVIGAMLVAPLLGPIMAISLGTLGGHRTPLATAAVALAGGVAVAILLSLGITEALQRVSLDVLGSIPGEVTARTRPNPLDLGVALAGGTIGAYGLARLRDTSALPGVAIATALMPPLCTVGIGIAADDRGVWGGALLLFATNFLAIVFSAAIVFWSLGLGRRGITKHASPRLVVGAAAIVVLGLALFGLTARAIRESREANDLRAAAENALEVVLPGSQVVEIKRSVASGGGLDVQLTARTPRSPSLEDAEAVQSLVAQRMQSRIALVLVGIPVIVLDPLKPPPRDVPIPIPGRSPSPSPSATPTPTQSPTATTSAPAPTATTTPSPTSIPPPVGNSPPEIRKR